MTVAGSAIVDFIANTARFNADVKKAAANLQSETTQMRRSMQTMQASVESLNSKAALARDLFVGSEITRVAGAALDYASSLGEVSQQLGITAEDLQIYRYAATQVGLSQEELDGGLSKLTRTLGDAQLGGKQSAAVFSALGVSIRDASGNFRTTSQIMPELIAAISSISDPARRAAIEVELFGRSGQKLDTLLAGGTAAMANMRKEAQASGMVLSDDLVQSADAAADSVAKLKKQLEVNVARVVAQNANAIYGLSGALQTLTVKGLGLVASYPRISGALAGLAAGARFGPWGAAAGAVGGLVLGDKAAKEAALANNDIGFRKQELANAYRAYKAELARDAKSGGGMQLRSILSARPGQAPAFRGSLYATQQSFEEQRKALLRAAASGRASAAPTLPAMEAPDLTGVLGGGGGAGGGGGGRKSGTARSATNRAEEDARRLSEAYDDLIAKERLLQDLGDMRAAGLGLEADLRQSDAEIADRLAGIDMGRLRTAQEMARLTIQNQAANEALAEMGKPAIDPSLWTTTLVDVGGKTVEFGKKVADTTDLVRQCWADTARDVLGSLDDLVSGIRGGGFLDTLSGVVNLLLSIGSTGLFGTKIATNIKGARASGGPVSAGGTYLVGEKGPELFTPAMSGRIIANDNIPRGGAPGMAAVGAALGRATAQHVAVEIVPSPYFDAVVDSRAAGIAAPMAVRGAAASSQMTETRMRRRAGRRMP